MFKLIIGLLVVGSILVLVQEYLSAKKQENEREDLKKELDGVNKELRSADAKEEVVDAKIKLKNRTDEIAAKAEVLNAEPVKTKPETKPAKKKAKKKAKAKKAKAKKART